MGGTKEKEKEKANGEDGKDWWKAGAAQGKSPGSARKRKRRQHLP